MVPVIISLSFGNVELFTMFVVLSSKHGLSLIDTTWCCRGVTGRWGVVVDEA